MELYDMEDLYDRTSLIGDGPRQSETSSAGEVVQLVVGCAFLFWAGKLLWG